MLQTLLGSQSATRILLFLWANEKATLSQIQAAYRVPLTPLQSMISKLLKANILSFLLHKKRKLYHLHVEHPLYPELRALLQKGFSFLSPEEKKPLFCRLESWEKASFRKRKQRALCLQNFWGKLKRVKQLTIRSSQAEAKGDVVVIEEGKNRITFRERGCWIHPDSKGMEFHNHLRWSFDFENGLVGLEHLRHGPDHPVFLFHLAPLSPTQLQSIDSHLCRNDTYFGQMSFNDQGMQFLWKILGPHKNETLIYNYIN